MKITKEDVIRAIGGLPRGWGIQEDDDRITLDTREHGDVAGESAGQQDIVDGRRILGILKTSFPENKPSAEVVDEWVIVTIQNGRKDEMKKFEERVAWAVRQSSQGHPYRFINVLVESPSKKGFYLVGALDGEANYDTWNPRRPPILIYPKNGVPTAVKLPESRDSWYTDITRRNHKLPSRGPLRSLLAAAIKRRLELEATIDSRIMNEVEKNADLKNYFRREEMRNKIMAQEFVKYKKRYLKEPRQITDDSTTFWTQSEFYEPRYY